MEAITAINNLNDFLIGVAKKENYPKGLQLNLYGNRLDNQGAKALANALQSGQCPWDLQLKLGSNQLGAEEAKVLAIALQSGSCPQGLQLKLSCNQLGPLGAKALAIALQNGQCPQRLQLNLEYNEIGAEGAEAIAMALQSGRCPQGLQLFLGGNRLAAKGAQTLAIALQSGQCPQGLKLDLRGNQLGTKGAQALALALQSGQCPQGLKLDLRSNPLGTKEMTALAMALQSRSCPQGLQLDLDNNQLDDKAKKALKRAWAVYYAHQQDDFINCMTLYQSHSQVDSPFNHLPQELLLEIYAYILPATPILAKMIEISAKVFKAQLSTHKLADTSVDAKQLNNAFETALSAKKFTEKAAKVRMAINDFLQKALETHDVEKVVQSPTVALLNKYHLLTKNTIQLATLSRKIPADELEGQPSLKKIKL